MALDNTLSKPQALSPTNRLVEGVDALYRAIETEAMAGSDAYFTPSKCASTTQTPTAENPQASPTYPRIWSRGHDEALMILAACLPLLCRQALFKLPFFDAWSGYSYSHLLAHLKITMKRMLKKLDIDFELPLFGKTPYARGFTLPDEVVRAMGDAIVGQKASGSATVIEKRQSMMAISSRSPHPSASNSSCLRGSTKWALLPPTIQPRGLILPPKTPPWKKTAVVADTDSESEDLFGGETPSPSPTPPSSDLPVTPRHLTRPSTARKDDALLFLLDSSTSADEGNEGGVVLGEVLLAPSPSSSRKRRRAARTIFSSDEGGGRGDF